MAAAKARGLARLPRYPQKVIPRGLVIGGGLAGMTSALALGDAGFEVYLVEKEKQLGGMLRRIHYTLGIEDTQAYLTELIDILFSGAPPPDPPEIADANCDGQTDALDLAVVIDHIFSGGPAPCE